MKAIRRTVAIIIFGFALMSGAIGGAFMFVCGALADLAKWVAE